MENIIELSGVSFMRDGKKLLSDINWTIQKGEHWAVLGLNGSGKTTLLNMINGYIWPTTGSIRVLGQTFGKTSLPELRKSIGWVSSSIQERIPRTQLARHVVISGKYASIGLYEEFTKEDEDKAIHLMEKLNCVGLADSPYEQCSQGERQKLLIARALMAEPRILILDEPCNGLDLFAREILLKSVEELAGDPNGPALIYVTHHPEEISPVFQKTLLLRRGEVFQQGDTSDMIEKTSLSRFFEHEIHVEWRGNRASFQLV
ncbi:ABC transporter ATP-binding protein [Weizmannia acidilactici]|uniref:ABC transporter ATP-binding protein n=1 Tax=Weizmannia acidilactici TaxID=2607726 RepID=A0A5J4JRC1_9BACI|nr:ABC transporter ATP-binding protein [Weizmannia acidilactici]GER66290.1 ABC transporter ATP-binding protein [Weizmannia acidilactici]GER71664.1 ABC transporter ATP-binding protein [Weizmannia acidilactici]GER73979.1 ABC transporter ATP-binding protein [Weizmannia acidilactici]